MSTFYVPMELREQPGSEYVTFHLTIEECQESRFNRGPAGQIGAEITGHLPHLVTVKCLVNGDINKTFFV